MTAETDNVHVLHRPNRAAMRAHLEKLFKRARSEFPNARCEIAWTDAQGRISFGLSFALSSGGLDEAAAEAARRNVDGINVYVGVNPRKGGLAPYGRASADEIECSYWQFADLDKPEGIERLRQALSLPYTMAVTTGRVPGPRVHIYWELDEPVTNFQAWTAQQEALQHHFLGDPVNDPPRVMRLAGSVSYPNARKLERGYGVEVVRLRTVYDEEERDPVSSEALRHAYPYQSKTENSGEDSGPAPPPGADRFDTGRKDPREYVRNIISGHNLHNNARDLVAHLVNTGHRDWLIRDYLDRLLRPVSDGGTLGQIEELIRSARQKYSTPDPPPEEDFDKPPPIDVYEPLDFAQLAALPPVSYLIDGLLTDYGLAVIYGSPASGKTFLALDMALHLAYGARWHGRELRQAGVLYIAGEGVRGIAKRIAAWRLCKGLQDGEAPFRILPHAIDLLALEDVQKLVRTIQHMIDNAAFPIGVIVIDTVARNMSGNENDAIDMNRLISAADALREKFGVAVIGIHHAGKDHEKGMRGSTALPGASDTIIEVTRNENVMCVTTVKQKDDDEPDPFYMEMVQVPTDRLSTQTSLVLRMLKAEDHRSNGNGNGKRNNPTKQQIQQIYDEIEQAWSQKRAWSNAPQSKQEGRFLPIWIAQNAGASPKDAQEWVNDWLMNRCLETAIYDTHSKAKGLRVISRPGTAQA